MNNTAKTPPTATELSTDIDLKVSFSQFRKLFETLPDPRMGQHNLQYPLAAMLGAALVALPALTPIKIKVKVHPAIF